jgi:hypothetical protein
MKYKNFTGPNVALAGGFVGGTPIGRVVPAFIPANYFFNGSLDLGLDEAFTFASWFKPDGTKLFYTGSNSDRIWQRTLSTPWNISTAGTSTSSNALTTTSPGPSGMAFDDVNGDKVLITDVNNSAIYKFSLSTPWDVTTLNTTAVQSNTSIYSGNLSPHGVWARSDGTLLLTTNASTTVANRVLSMSTPWDISTLTQTSTIAGNANDRGVSFMASGTKYAVLATNTMIVYDVNGTYTTANTGNTSYTSLVSSQLGSIGGDIYFRDNGQSFYITTTNGFIHQYFKR